MPDPHNLPAVIANQSPTYRTFMVHALEPEGDHGLVGRANVGNVVRGAFHSASIGYDVRPLRRAGGSSPRGSRSSSTSSSPTSPRAWGCTGSKPTSSRRTFDPPAASSPSASSTKGSPRISSTSRAMTAAAHGVTTTATMLSSDWPAVPYRHATASTRRRRRGAAGHGAVGLAPRAAVEARRAALLRIQGGDAGGLFELLRETTPSAGSSRASWPDPSADGARACRSGPAVAPVFDAMEDASKRDVVDGALRVRAAFATHER